MPKDGAWSKAHNSRLADRHVDYGRRAETTKEQIGQFRFLSDKGTRQRIAQAAGCDDFPSRSTFFRRYKRAHQLFRTAIRLQGEKGLAEGVADPEVVAVDKSLIAARGPLWHKRDRQIGRIPKGLHGVDQDSTWACSQHDGWVQGYSFEVLVTATAGSTVYPLLASSDTASAKETQTCREKMAALPKNTRYVLIDSGYDSNELAEQVEYDDNDRPQNDVSSAPRTAVAAKAGKTHRPHRRAMNITAAGCNAGSSSKAAKASGFTPVGARPSNRSTTGSKDCSNWTNRCGIVASTTTALKCSPRSSPTNSSCVTTTVAATRTVKSSGSWTVCEFQDTLNYLPTQPLPAKPEAASSSCFPIWQPASQGFFDLPPIQRPGLLSIERDQPMPSQKQIREDITAKIIEALEKGVRPWQRPWTVSPNTGRPKSLAGHIYHGINPLLLEMHNLRFGLRSRWWGTFRAWSNLACTVKKRPSDVEPGNWGCRIVLFRPITKTIVDKATGQEEEHDFYMMRYFTVFSADQVEGKVAERLQVKDEPVEGVVLPDYGPAEELIAATGADIRHGGDRAYYCRPMPEGTWPNHTDGDYIRIPPKHRYVKSGCYYETLAHELCHWSELRTGWNDTKEGYPAGELAAEIGATYLCSELGVPCGEDLANHAAYLQSWLSAMKADPSYIFKASTQASKATDYLLSLVKKEEAVVAE